MATHSHVRQPTVEKIPLHSPPLDEVATVLRDGLKSSYENVAVSVVDCPDLTSNPFTLAGAGINGNPRVTDIGGTPFLFPTPQMNKLYDLSQVPQWLEMPSHAFVVGAGAAPNHVIGVLGELVSNFTVDKNKSINNKTYSAKVNEKDGSCVLEQLNQSCDAFHLINLFVSEGKPGKVIEVRVSKRTGSLHFINSLQTTLKNHYGTQPVGLGGTFLLAKGKARIHIMPCYSEVPLESNSMIQDWLKFFEMKSPLVSVGYLLSHDPGLKLRMQHFHCFSDHGEGGHFHFDTTPEEAEYVGYFNVPEYMYRVDMFQIEKSDALGM